MPSHWRKMLAGMILGEDIPTKAPRRASAPKGKKARKVKTRSRRLPSTKAQTRRRKAYNLVVTQGGTIDDAACELGVTPSAIYYGLLKFDKGWSQARRDLFGSKSIRNTTRSKRAA